MKEFNRRELFFSEPLGHHRQVRAGVDVDEVGGKHHANHAEPALEQRFAPQHSDRAGDAAQHRPQVLEDRYSILFLANRARMDELNSPRSIWLEDLRRWLKELGTVELELERVERLLEHHEAELKKHLEAINEPGDEAALYAEHERLKRRHHTLMAQLGLLARGIAALEEEVFGNRLP